MNRMKTLHFGNYLTVDSKSCWMTFSYYQMQFIKLLSLLPEEIQHNLKLLFLNEKSSIQVSYLS